MQPLDELINTIELKLPLVKEGHGMVFDREQLKIIYKALIEMKGKKEPE